MMELLTDHILERKEWNGQEQRRQKNGPAFFLNQRCADFQNSTGQFAEIARDAVRDATSTLQTR